MASHRKSELDRARRDAIVDAAVTLFSEQGYSGTSMQSIAEAAGFSVGYLYKHFGCKEELLDEIVLASIDRMEETQQVLAPTMDGTALGRLRMMSLAGAELLAEDPRLVQLLHRQEGVIQSRMRATFHEMRERDRGLLNEAVAAGEIEPVDTSLLVAVIDGVTWELFLTFGLQEPERIREVPGLVDEFVLDPLRTNNGGEALNSAAKGNS